MGNMQLQFMIRDSFNFSIVNFPYLSSNIPSKPAYGVYISQLVRIGRICDNFNFEQFNDRHYKLTSKLTKKVSGILSCAIYLKGFPKPILKYSVNIIMV